MFTKDRLDRYVEKGWLSCKEKDGLSLYCYTPEAQFGKHWDDVTIACRGLIIDQNGKLVARPFPKFFNLGEMPQTFPQNLPKGIFEVAEKLDGSLAISYWKDGHIHFATKGSFESEQAEVANKIWRDRYYHLESIMPKYWTFLFEIIHPVSKVVISYDYEDLVLLGVNDLYSDLEMGYKTTASIAKSYGFRSPGIYAKTVDMIINEQDNPYDNTEGYVLMFENGLRVKVKNKMYVKYHRMVSQFTDKNVWDLMRSGEYERFLSECPEEYRDEVEKLAEDIRIAHQKMVDEANEAFRASPMAGSDKDFALWVQANHLDLAPILFSLRKGKLDNVNKIVYNKIKEKLGI